MTSSIGETPQYILTNAALAATHARASSLLHARDRRRPVVERGDGLILRHLLAAADEDIGASKRAERALLKGRHGTHLTPQRFHVMVAALDLR